MQINNFQQQIKRLTKQYLPQARFKVIYSGSFHGSFRVVVQDKLFVDIYYNSKKDRYDFSLILRGKRIFGIDNYQGWHKHPFNNVEKHQSIDQSDLKNVFIQIREIIGQL